MGWISPSNVIKEKGRDLNRWKIRCSKFLVSPLPAIWQLPTPQFKKSNINPSLPIPRKKPSATSEKIREERSASEVVNSQHTGSEQDGRLCLRLTGDQIAQKIFIFPAAADDFFFLFLS